MASCNICGRADLVWREKYIKVGTPEARWIWTIHDPHNPNKEFAYQTHEHVCPWKAVKHMEKKDRPFYWRTL